VSSSILTCHLACARCSITRYCGSIDTNKEASAAGGSAHWVLFYPLDRRIPRIRIRTRQLDAIVGQRIVVVVDGWEANSKYVKSDEAVQAPSAGSLTKVNEPAIASSIAGIRTATLCARSAPSATVLPRWR